MILASVLVAAALANPQEAKLQALLPEVFAKSAAHYRAIDAAATPLMNSRDASKDKSRHRAKP